ncbi:DUF418 domain-containing protein [Flavobacterium sp.]|uniref:DUF418 domain-containing protein n=1 Tax=Flavobacterium sp. TaxID=239 RepID=UPI0022C815FA|nr:DUF418 domain-containing protein [Flavobacterium sp.]MCZ8090501.1 DUF418 domain-containing protein [Flavobacterium sp.]
MKTRIIGFDLARAYAIFGMFIVNFNMVFGSYKDQTIIGKFLSLFSGNSSTVFVILAGMGIALMTNRSEYSNEEKIKLRNTILKRALFLFVAGLLLNFIWPADILHFYGCYMFISAFLIFLNRSSFLWLATLPILIFHFMIFIIPYETGWNIEKFQYKDFYTLNGFIRNTFYNGWNSIFPWIAYFFLGIFLGRLNWTEIKVQRKMFFIGLSLYLTVNIIQLISQHITVSTEVREFINADYLPPFLPFILSTFGFGLMLISGFMYLGNKIGESQIAKNFASTGQMTLTHYVSHVTIGMILFSILAGKDLSKDLTLQQPTDPIYVLLFSIVYFVFSFYFSKLWTKKFKNGPLETLMRRISG